MASELSTLAERYVLEAPVARGGMGTVYKARDDVLARTIAVKVLHTHLAGDADFLERFRHEALAAARLTHPNIVSIYDTGSDGGDDGPPRHYIVMEFCGRGSVADHLDRTGPLDPDSASRVGVEVCEALGYAHRAGVIHRDVKPANVLITSDGSLKVADFGIAKAAFVAGDVSTTGSILGTVTYLSPEQLRGEEPDARSDLYALGVMLYELLAGKPPFAEETQMATAMKHLREDPPALRSVRGGIPRSLDTVVMRALAKEPSARYGSAEEMRIALEGRGGVGSTAVFEPAAPPTVTTPVRRTDTPPQPQPRPPSTPPGPSRPSRRGALIAVIVALAVAGAIAAALLVRGLGDVGGEGAGSGARTGGGGGSGEQGGASGALQVAGVSDLDPAGDGEHPEEAALAADGDAGTAWNTSQYQSPIQALGKPGVGLVFDLGEGAEVSEVTLEGCDGCDLELRVSDETSDTDPNGFDVVEEANAFTSGQTFEFDPTEGRYWLVFITSLPGGGGGSASLSEVTFRGPG